MKLGTLLLLLPACFLFFWQGSAAAEPATAEMSCAPGTVPLQDSSGFCAGPEGSITPAAPEGSLLQLLPLPSGAPAGITARAKNPDKKTVVYLFRGKGCPHCEEEVRFLAELKRDHPTLEIRDYEVWYNRENARLMAAMLRAHGVNSSGVPVTFVDDRLFSGFTPQTGNLIATVIEKCMLLSCRDPGEGIIKTGQAGPSGTPPPFAAVSTAAAGGAETGAAVTIPLLGDLDARNVSLPMLTLVIAGMDSFNPCAFFVLLSLLGLLVHAQSRKKMLLIGGIFVLFSGLIYFLFMAAWLNLFLVMGHVALITTAAGVVSVVIAAINIKDFFLFRRGISLSIPDSAKPKLFDRMRRLLRSTSLLSILIGATVLAVVANFYELLCTAGFPMVFTRILTLNKLSPTTYYLYLLLYNIIYVIPLATIVLGFTVTLGKRQLSEWQGRFLKLVSGTMMLGLGAVLLINPALMNSVWVSFGILVTALGVALLTAAVTRKCCP